MSFIEKVKRAVTGKTYEERQQERYAMREIRKKVMSARLKEREAQAIRFAKKREEVEYNKRTKLLTSKPQSQSKGVFSGLDNYFGNMNNAPRQSIMGDFISPSTSKKQKRYRVI